VGFTNEVTVAVWVGYDNAYGKRRTLGSGQTGASVAIPIFEPIIQATWTYVAPKTALAPPSPEARRFLVARGAGRGDDDEGGGRGIVEYLRRDANGKVRDTQYQLVSREEVDVYDPRETERNSPPWGQPQPQPQQQPQQQWSQPWGFFGWQQQPQQQQPKPQAQPTPPQQYRTNDPRYRQQRQQGNPGYQYQGYPNYYER
jgi:penicillin-binding protein 1A